MACSVGLHLEVPEMPRECMAATQKCHKRGNQVPIYIQACCNMLLLLKPSCSAQGLIMWSSGLESPRRHSKLLFLTPHLPYKDTALSMGRHWRCQRYCSHRACSSGNPGSQTGSDCICLLHNLPYMDTDLATSLGEKTATLIHHEVPGLKAGAGKHRWHDLFEQDVRYSWLNRALFLRALTQPWTTSICKCPQLSLRK